MQSNILLDAFCLVALVAFGASAMLAAWLLHHKVAPRSAARPAVDAPSPSPRPAMHARLSTPPAPAQHAPVNSAPPPYGAIPTLLTAAEQQFFAALQAAVPPAMLICPQVRLANLVQPTARRPKQHQYDFFRIQAKCVDFVLCDQATTAPRLVIELDDSSHDRPDRQARDAFVDSVLAAAHLPILHVPWRRSYDAAELAAAIRTSLGIAPQPDASEQSADGWTKPIAVQPHRLTLPASPRYERHHVCGTCHGIVRPESRYCTHCGTPFAQPLAP